MKQTFFVILLIAALASVANAAIVIDSDTVIEAEAMSIKSTGKAVADGWALMGAGHVAEDLIFSDYAVEFEVIAKGDMAVDIWPLMELRIDGAVFDTVSIDSATWKTFRFRLPVTPGTRQIAFAFINDYWQDPIDRNFYIDKVIVRPLPGRARVTLAWDANTEPDLAGYNIYFGTASGDYKPPINVRNRTEYLVVGMKEGGTYYFAATAYDEDDNESAFSEELVHTFGYGAPGEGKGFRYKDVKRYIIW